MKIPVLLSSVILILGAVALLLALPLASVFSQTAPAKPTQAFQELFDYSLKEKKGLTFFVQGQTVPGVVTKMVGEEAIDAAHDRSSVH